MIITSTNSPQYTPFGHQINQKTKIKQYLLKYGFITLAEIKSISRKKAEFHFSRQMVVVPSTVCRASLAVLTKVEFSPFSSEMFLHNKTPLTQQKFDSAPESVDETIENILKMV